MAEVFNFENSTQDPEHSYPQSAFQQALRFALQAPDASLAVSTPIPLVHAKHKALWIDGITFMDAVSPGSAKLAFFCVKSGSAPSAPTNSADARSGVVSNELGNIAAIVQNTAVTPDISSTTTLRKHARLPKDWTLYCALVNGSDAIQAWGGNLIAVNIAVRPCDIG